MIKIYDNFVSKLFKGNKKREISFSSHNMGVLYDLGFTNDDYYDVNAFHYKPITEDNDIEDIRVSINMKTIKPVTKEDGVLYDIISYEIQITQKNGEKIIKTLDNAKSDDTSKQNIYLFDEFIELVKSCIPELDQNIKKYNL